MAGSEEIAEQKRRRPFVALLGLVLALVAGYGLWSYIQLVAFVIDAAGSGSLSLDYLPLGLAIGCTLVAGLSLLVSAINGRSRNLVPGPTLYLLGLSIAVVAIQVWLTTGDPISLLGLLVGAVLIVLEYRLDVL
ncbi:MAG: hypothetical protein AAFN07_05690 [Pseudomonadota bacterium]